MTNEKKETVEINRPKKSRKAILVMAVVIFTFAGLLLLHILNSVFMPTTEMNEYNKKYHSLPDGSVDVLFVGGSQFYRGINPVYMWQEYGIAGFSKSSIGMTPIITHLFAIDAIKSQKPDVLVMSPGSMLAEETLDKSNFIGPTIFAMNSLYPSADKLKTIYEIERSSDNYSAINFVFPVLKYHDRWDELRKIDFTGKDCGYTRGNSAIWSVRDQSEYEPNMIGKIDEEDSPSYSYNKDAIDYYERIIKYCKANDVEVMLLSLPKYGWGNDDYHATKDLAEKYDLNYLDLNTDKNFEDVGLDSKSDWYDKFAHVNGWGALKVSDYVGKYLKENYQLEDKRKGDSEAVQLWEEDYNTYHKQYANLIPEHLKGVN